MNANKNMAIIRFEIDRYTYEEAKTAAKNNSLKMSQFYVNAINHYLDYLQQQEIDQFVATADPKKVERALKRFEENPEEREAYRKKQEEKSNHPEIQRIDREFKKRRK